jgi:hypothetical protein
MRSRPREAIVAGLWFTIAFGCSKVEDTTPDADNGSDAAASDAPIGDGDDGGEDDGFVLDLDTGVGPTEVDGGADCGESPTPTRRSTCCNAVLCNGRCIATPSGERCDCYGVADGCAPDMVCCTYGAANGCTTATLCGPH